MNVLSCGTGLCTERKGPVAGVERWYQASVSGDPAAAGTAIQDSLTLSKDYSDGSVYGNECRLLYGAFARLAAADGSEMDKLSQPGEVKIGTWANHESLRKTETGFVMEAFHHSGLGGYGGPMSSGSWVIRHEMDSNTGMISTTSTRMTGFTGRGRAHLSRQKYRINPSTQEISKPRNGLLSYLPEV